jgi:transcriptional regulator with XRE-family HTH domain
MTMSDQESRRYELALGEAIRQLREYKGMTQAELAEGAGVDEATVARIESGEESPLPLDMLFDLTKEGLHARLGELGHLADQYLGRVNYPRSGDQHRGLPAGTK